MGFFGIPNPPSPGIGDGVLHFGLDRKIPGDLKFSRIEDFFKSRDFIPGIWDFLKSADFWPGDLGLF